MVDERPIPSDWMNNPGYWYRKGIEDLENFILDSLPEEQALQMKNSFKAINGQLDRNFKLIEMLMEKEKCHTKKT